MEAIEKTNSDIIDIYEKWRKEIAAVYPYLLGEDFSNVFCTGVLKNWRTSNMRILVVGEEATWKSRKFYNYNGADELQQCQQWILDELNKQLYDDTVKKHISPFWRRMRVIHAAFPNASIGWTNIDVINSKSCRALREEDRQALHSCKTQVLREAVALLKPTHILFFGWHNTSLQHEFPELMKKVYPRKYGDTVFMKENGYIFKTDYEEKIVVFTYHPSWLRANSNSYIERLISVMKE